MSEDVMDFDRTMARRRVVPFRDVVSLAAFFAETKRCELTKDPDTWPDGLIDTLTALDNGEAALVVPDGSRWIAADAIRDFRFLQRLIECLVAHRFLRECGEGSRLSSVFLDAATLDLRRAFCTGCSQWIDLEGEVAEADRMEAAGEIAPWEDD